MYAVRAALPTPVGIHPHNDAGLAVANGLTVRRGAAVFATLVPLGIYEPPWKYPPKELAIDLSYHLVYGLGVAGAYRLLERI